MGDSEFIIFIGGLAYKTEIETLEQFLKEQDVHPTKVRIIERDGQSRGFGYADFDSKEESEKCIALTGMELDGRSLICNEADAPGQGRGGRGRGGRGGGGGRRGGRDGGYNSGGGGGGGGGNFDNTTPTKLIMVKNLAWATKADGLYAVFPDATDARVVMDRMTEKSRGFAFVEFSDIESAQAAREKYHEQEIDGRQVNIVFATPREDFRGGRGRGGFND